MAYVGLGAGRNHREVNAYIAHLEGVVAAVHAQGEKIAGKAKSNLAAHRDTGASEVGMFTDDIDAVVYLEDEAAVTIEYGRGADSPSGAMQGLHILGRAAGL